MLLRYLIPQLLGRQYLNGYGGAEELQIFQVEILLLAVVFTLLVILSASEQVIWQTVNRTCIEGMHYTEQKGSKKQQHGKAGHADKGAVLNKKKKRNTGTVLYGNGRTSQDTGRDLSLQLVHCSSE